MSGWQILDQLTHLTSLCLMDAEQVETDYWCHRGSDGLGSSPILEASWKKLTQKHEGMKEEQLLVVVKMEGQGFHPEERQKKSETYTSVQLWAPPNSLGDGPNTDIITCFCRIATILHF